MGLGPVIKSAASLHADQKIVQELWGITFVDPLYRGLYKARDLSRWLSVQYLDQEPTEQDPESGLRLRRAQQRDLITLTLKIRRNEVGC